jgi:hypothetical protein
LSLIIDARYRRLQGLATTTVGKFFLEICAPDRSRFRVDQWRRVGRRSFKGQWPEKETAMVSSQNPKSRTVNTHSIAAAFARLIQAARRLFHDVGRGRNVNLHFDDVSVLIATVPLTTEEYDLAAQRLQNAMRYTKQGETGAARYELAALVRRLNHASHGHRIAN